MANEETTIPNSEEENQDLELEDSVEPDDAEHSTEDEEDEASAETDVDDDGEESDSDQTDETGEEEDKETRIQHAFKKKAYLLNEERRKRAEAEAKAKELEEKLRQTTAPKEPVIPPVPDPYDPDYAAKMEQRDKAIIAKHDYDNQVRYAELQQQQGQQQAVEQRKAEIETMQQGYQKKAKDLNIDVSELTEHEETIASYLDPLNKPQDAQLAEYILGHEEGPLLVTMLGNEPLVMDKLAGMSPMQASAYIERTLVTKAQKYRPKPTKAPEPVDVIETKGKVKSDSPWVAGATFE